MKSDLKIVGIILVGLVGVFVMKTFRNPLVYLSVLGMGGYAIVKLDRQIESEEYPEFAGRLYQEVKTIVEPVKAYQGLKGIFINPAPSFKVIYDMAREVKADFSWFSKFRAKSMLVCGISGDGKTSFQLNEVAEFIKENPNGLLRICDLDYGLSHEGTEPNYWFDLPEQQFISKSYEEILEDFQRFSELIDDRVSKGRDKSQTRYDWEWGLHVVDELVAFIQMSKDNGDYEEVIKMVKKVLNRGLKVKIRCCYGVQNMSVTDSGISTSAQDSFNIVLLGSSTLNRDYLKRIGVTTSKEQDEMIARVTALRKVHPYSCVTRMAQVASVETLPTFVNNFQYEDPFKVWQKNISEASLEIIKEFAKTFVPGADAESIKPIFEMLFADTSQQRAYIRSLVIAAMPEDDDDSTWWSTVFTPEIRSAWQTSINEWHLGNIKSPLKPSMAMIFKNREMTQNNLRYVLAKSVWDQMVKPIKDSMVKPIKD